MVVQSRQSDVKTRWLLDVAAVFPLPQAVVGWVDLTASDIERVLDGYRDEARLRGLRHFLSLEPDPGFMARSDFLHGLKCAADRGLTFDLLLRPDQLADAARLVGRLPGARFVLDHLGNPPVCNRDLEPWATDLRSLAGSGDVWCKVSGFLTTAAWGRWKPAEFSPFFDAALDVFGTERLLWGSDWPVCTCSGPYRATLRIVERWLRTRAPAAADDVLSGNAVAAYRLDRLVGVAKWKQ